MKVEIAEADLWHLMAVLGDLRDFERAHVEKMYGSDYINEAARLFARSPLSFTGLVDERPVVVWGVCVKGMLSEQAWLWLLGSKYLEEHPVAFLRHTKKQIGILRAMFPQLYGMVLTELDCGERWLKWLGFEVGPDEGGIRAFVSR